MSEKFDGENKLEFATQWRRLIPLMVAVFGVLLVLSGVLFQYINSTQNKSLDPNKFLVSQPKHVDEKDETNVLGVNSVVKSRMIKIDISGSVINPGVVEIPSDSRIQDVLITADGLSPKADRIYVSRYINLAQRVVDGMKIYIPAVGENPVNNSINQLSNKAINMGIQGSININNASESDLDSLPGVGSVTAGKIISGRPYGNISELTSRKILGTSVFEKIKDKISAY